MVDRRLFGDAALAILLALPTAVLARPDPDIAKHHATAAAPLIAKAAVVERWTAEGRTALG